MPVGPHDHHCCEHALCAAGEAVPKKYHGILHPVVVTAVIANAGAALHGQLLGWSYIKAQQVYLTKVRRCCKTHRHEELQLLQQIA